MTKIIRISPRKARPSRLDVRGLPPTLLKDGWWLGDFTILPAGFHSASRHKEHPEKTRAEQRSATIIPFRKRARKTT
jgi:hypothetical protein